MLEKYREEQIKAPNDVVNIIDIFTIMHHVESETKNDNTSKLAGTAKPSTPEN
jgi:hypothetical protein